MTQDDRQYEAIDVEGGSTGIFGDVNNSVISRDFIVNLVTRDIGRHNSIKGLKRSGTADNKGHALLITCQQGYTDAVQQYLEDGANWRFTEQDEQTCLFKAVHAGHVEIVTLLLSDPERREKLLTKPDRQWLDTPLHRAAIQGHAEIVRILLSYDHPVDPLQRDGLTPLQLAVDKDHVNVVSLLISRGANVRHENYLRDSTLHLAARHGHIDTFQVILAKDSTSSFLEQRNIFGDTALFLTGLHDHVDSARLLIEHSASVSTLR